MAAAILDEVTPALETSTHMHERTGGLAATAERCRMGACDVLSKAPMPPGELSDKWQRLVFEGQTSPHGDFLQRLTELYWACLSRLERLVVDAEASVERRL